MEAEKIPLPQSLEYVVNSCGTKNLDTDDFENIADGVFCIALALKKTMNHVKIVINGMLPRNEQNTARRQKLFIANESWKACWKTSVLITSIPIFII